jgi:hypothetical protein
MSPAQAWDLVHYIKSIVNTENLWQQEPSLENYEKTVAAQEKK